MALTDTYLSMAGALVLLSAWRFSAAPARARAVWLGLAMTLALTIKTPGLLFLPIPCLVLLFFRKKPWALYLKGLALSYCFPLATLAVFFLKGGWSVAMGPYIIAVRTGSVSAALGPILAVARGNLDSILDWLRIFLTLPMFYLGLAALVFSLLRWDRFGLFWVAVGATFLLPFVFGAGTLFPRYILFGAIPLFFLTGATLQGFRECLRPFEKRARSSVPVRLFMPLLAVVIFAPMLRFDYQLMTRPEKARLPSEEEAGFITGWPGGYGGRETYEYLDAFSRHASARVRVVRFGLSDGASGALRVYGFKSPHLELRDLDLIRPASLELLRGWAQQRPTFVVMDDPPFFPGQKPDLEPLVSLLRPVFRADKPGGLRAIVTYRVVGQGGAARGRPA